VVLPFSVSVSASVEVEVSREIWVVRGWVERGEMWVRERGHGRCFGLRGWCEGGGGAMMGEVGEVCLV
jgi:hypothetical protein